MKKTKLYLTIALLLAALFALLAACTNGPTKDVNGEDVIISYENIEQISVLNTDSLQEEGLPLSDFDYSQIIVEIRTTDEQVYQVPLKETWVKAESKQKLNQPGTYVVDCFYGKYDFTFTLKLYAATETLYVVTFYDETGERLIGEQYCKEGVLPVIPTLETKEGYTHTGWAEKGSSTLVRDFSVKKNVAYVAVYERDSYTVRYYYRAGEQTVLIKTATVPTGGNALDYAPDIPVLSGYSNGRWENEGSMRSVGEGNSDFYAIYDTDSVIVTFSYYKFSKGEYYDYKVSARIDAETEGVNPPTDVEKNAGSVFLYWYTVRNGNEVKAEFPYKVVGEMNFVAKYASYDLGTENLLYEMNGNGDGYVVTGLKAGSDDKIIVIPEYHLGRPVTEIADGAFKDFDIEKFVVASSNSRFRSYDGVLYNAALNEIVAYPKANKKTEFSTVGSLKTIRAYAFYGAEYLKNLTLGANVETIGHHAFASCKALEMLTIPAGVTEIPESIIENSESLFAFEMAGDVTEIGDNAFRNASSLERIVLPSALETMGENVFYGCKSLRSIETPVTGARRTFNTDRSTGALYRYNDSKTNQYYYLYAYPAKYSGENNASEFTLNATTTIVKKGAFIDAALLGIYVPTVAGLTFEEESVVCPSLISLRFDGGTVTLDPNTFGGKKPEVLYVPNDSFLTEDCGVETVVRTTSEALYRAFNDGFAYIFTETKEVLIVAYKGTEKDLVIPERLGAFTVVGIEDEAFAYNSFIETVKIPDSVYAIGNRAFYGCKNLKEVTLSDKLVIVGEHAFGGTNGAVRYHYNASGVRDYGEDAFGNVSEDNADENGVIVVAGVVTGMVGYRKNLVIPKSTVVIGNDAFRGKSFISTVDFSQAKNLESIKESAFEGCEELTGISFPTGLADISGRAFADCVRLQVPETLPESTSGDAFENAGTVATTVWEREDDLLLRYNGRSSIVVLPSDLTEISANAFAGNNFIETVVLGENIVSVGERAFYDCDSLKTVIFGENVADIASMAFAYCEKLSEVNYKEAKMLETIAYDAFENTAWLNEYVDDSLIVNGIFYKYLGTLSELHIMNSVKKINERAFYENETIDVLYFPESIEIIGEEAFTSSDIAKFNFGTRSDFLTEIGERAFENCKKLSFLDMRTFTSLKTIGERAFADLGAADGGVLNVYISASVEEIGKSAFENAEISTVRFESGSRLKEIKERTFYGNELLESVIFAGESMLGEIGESAFENCSGLKVFSCPAGQVEKIGANAFKNDSAMTEFKIGESRLEEVGEDAFTNVGYVTQNDDNMIFVGTVLVKYNGALSETVLIPAKTTVIGKSAFKDNTYLKEIVFEEKGGSSSLKEIQESAFENCSALEELSLPASVEKIGEKAFYNCGELSSVSLNYVKELSYEAFGNCTKLAVVSIPTTLTTFEGGVFEGCSSLMSISMDSNAKYYSQDGVLYDYSYDRIDGINVRTATLLAYPNGKYVEGGVLNVSEKITVGGNDYTVSGIGAYAFSGCSYENIQEINLHKNVRSIGKKAFAGVRAQVRFASAATISEIGDYAFADYIGEELVIPETVKKIGKNAFEKAVNFVTISIPQNVEEIGSYSFNGTDMTVVWSTEPKIGSLSDYAFVGYEGQEIVVPSSVERIGKYAFSGVTAEVRIESELERIDDYAFYGYAGEHAIDIPQSVRAIGDNAFANASNLSAAIEIPSNVSEIGKYAFVKVKEVFLPQNSALTEIGEYSFAEFDGEAITLPRGIREIGRYAFYNADRLVVDFSLCSNLESIGSMSFYNNALTELKIDDNVHTIGDKAFAECHKLNKVTFEDNNGVTYLGKGVLGGCDVLKEIVIPYLGTAYEENGLTVRNNHLGVLFGGDGYASNSSVVPSSLKKVTVLSGEVNANAFYKCENLEEIVLSENCVLYENAFVGCNGLKKAVLPYGQGMGTLFGTSNASIPTTLARVEIIRVTELENNAFYGCTNISEVILPETLVRIGAAAFYNCSKISEVDIGPNVVEIGDNAFARCSSLKNVTVHEANENYVDSDGVLYQINSSEKTAKLIVYPQERAGSTYAVELKVGEEEYTVTEIKGYAFYYANLKDIYIPETVDSIGDYAFYYAAIESARICTANIGRNAFNGCKNLKTYYLNNLSVVLSQNNSDKMYDNANVICLLADIDLDAVSDTVKGNAYVLKTFTQLSKNNGTIVSMEEFGTRYNVYYRSTGTGKATIQQIPLDFNAQYSSVYVDGIEYADGLAVYPVGLSIEIEARQTAGNYLFLGWFNGADLVSAESTFTYKVENKNVAFSARYAYVNAASATGQTTEWYVVEEGSTEAISYSLFVSDQSELVGHKILYVVGNGAVNAFGDDKSDWKTTVTEIIIGGDIRDIAAHAFEGYIAVERIRFDAPIETIGEMAFAGCVKLEEIDLQGVVAVGNSAFSGCGKLTKIIVGDTLERIREKAFEGTAITEITLGKSVSGIEIGAFDGCDYLRNVYVSDENEFFVAKNGVLFSYDSANAEAALVLYPTGRDEMYTIPEFVEKWCIGYKVVSVLSGAFYGCKSLLSVTIGENLKTIGRNVFTESGVTSVVVSEKNECFVVQNDVLYALYLGANEEKIALVVYNYSEGEPPQTIVVSGEEYTVQ